MAVGVGTRHVKIRFEELGNELKELQTVMNELDLVLYLK